MADDIAPLTPMRPTPLVREKRRYPGDKSQTGQQQKKKPEEAEQDDHEKSEQDLNKTSSAENDSADSSVDKDKKTDTVMHIDEYA
jgi:hypothetical protein